MTEAKLNNCQETVQTPRTTRYKEENKLNKAMHHHHRQRIVNNTPTLAREECQLRMSPAPRS